MQNWSSFIEFSGDIPKREAAHRRAMADLAVVRDVYEAAKCRKIEPGHTSTDMSDCQSVKAHANLYFPLTH